MSQEPLSFHFGRAPHTVQEGSASLANSPAPLLQDSMGNRAACEAATWQALWAGREVVIDRWVLRRQGMTASQITSNLQHPHDKANVACEACWTLWAAGAISMSNSVPTGLTSPGRAVTWGHCASLGCTWTFLWRSACAGPLSGGITRASTAAMLRRWSGSELLCCSLLASDLAPDQRRPSTSEPLTPEK